jgi:hypothetical protein
MGIAQCGNSIAIKKAAVLQSGLTKVGTIEVSVSTVHNYTCTLSLEKGSGIQKIAEKKGNGNSSVSFKELDPNGIYQVLFEFLPNNDNKISTKDFCQKLQKSGIILEAE